MRLKTSVREQLRTLLYANDDILKVVANAALDWGAEERTRKTERAEKAATRKANREAREAKMEAKRAAWRAEREDEPDVGK